MNRPFTNCYNSDDGNISSAELRQTKTKPVSFVIILNLLCETKSNLKKYINFKKYIVKLEVFLYLTVNWNDQILNKNDIKKEGYCILVCSKTPFNKISYHIETSQVGFF